MEEEHNIDKIFRENLEGFEDGPSEQVWTSISGELDKKKKSRGFGLFWFVLLAGLISFGTYEYISKVTDPGPLKKNNEVEFTERTPAVISATNNTINSNSVSENSSLKEVVNTVAAVTSKTEDLSATGGMSKQDVLPVGNAEPKSVMNPRSATQKVISSNEGETESGARKARPVITVPAASEAMLSSARGFNQSIENEQADKSIHENQNIPAQNKSEIADQDDSKSNAEVPSEKNTAGLNPEPSNNSRTPVQQTAVASAGSASEKINSGNSEEPMAIEKITPPSPDSAAANASAENAVPAAKTSGFKNTLKKIGANSSIALFYSPDYAANRTTGAVNAESQTAGYSWSSGIKIGYDLSKRFGISCGANYSFYSKSESFSTVYVTSDDEYKEEHEGDHDHGYEHGHGHNGGGHNDDEDEDGPGEDGNHYVVHTSCGDIDLSDLPPQSTGDEESGETLALKSTVASSVEFINVPLKLRYNFRSRNLVYYVEAGGSIGFIVNSDAKISIGSYSESSVVSGLTNHQYSALLNLGVEYRFFRGIGLFLEPNLRYSITPINDSGTEKSYPYFIGANAGLSIHF